MAILDLVNVAAMTAQTKASLTNGQQALVSGYTTANDGGGGTFFREAGSSTAANGGTVFAADEGGHVAVACTNYSGSNARPIFRLTMFTPQADATLQAA